MPIASPRPCSKPGCGKLVPHGGPCPGNHPTREQARDRARGTFRERGYDTRWDKLSKRWRRLHPLCALCKAQGKTVLGDLVDHIVSVRRAPERVLDESNLQTLCTTCHNAKTNAEDGGGFPHG